MPEQSDDFQLLDELVISILKGLNQVHEDFKNLAKFQAKLWSSLTFKLGSQGQPTDGDKYCSTPEDLYFWSWIDHTTTTTTVTATSQETEKEARSPLVRTCLVVKQREPPGPANCHVFIVLVNWGTRHLDTHDPYPRWFSTALWKVIWPWRIGIAEGKDKVCQSGVVKEEIETTCLWDMMELALHIAKEPECQKHMR